jgi:hypothetical protein
LNPLEQTEHRPYPAPEAPWLMGQRWHDLLFAHWRVEPELIQRLLPPRFVVDTFDGWAWVALVPFEMTDVRPRGLPGFPPVSNFLELNVRTYARVGDLSGVYFFSLDASSRLAVAAARRGLRLPYFDARMAMKRRDDWIDYQSVRIREGSQPARLEMSYRPSGPVEFAPPGSLEFWLIERYRLMSELPGGRAQRIEIHHAPWPLQPAEWTVHANTMTDWLGFSLDREPDHVRFARFQDVLTWRPRGISLEGNISE